MEDHRTLETLEEELKLLKGELKQSLASVRDYLLNMELPSSEFATVLAALGGENDQKITLNGGVLNKAASQLQEPPAVETEPEETTEEEEYAPEDSLADESELSPEEEELQEQEIDEPEPETGQERYGGDSGESFQNGFDEPMSEELLPDEDTDNLDAALGDSLEEDFDTGEEEDILANEPELLTEEELPMEQVKVSDETTNSIPKVNLLANLINWVSRAKRDIGAEQIPVLLEVYGISGHLSPELKEVIMHLTDITQEQDIPSPSEIWSQTMSALHGILTGGDAPLYPLKPFWAESELPADSGEEVDEIEVEKAQDMPVKLKLVFPNGDGKGKEFCIDLTPEKEAS